MLYSARFNYLQNGVPIMRKALAISLLALSLSATVRAGEVPFPPLPPPCTENCSSSSTTTLPTLTYELIVKLITSRP